MAARPHEMRALGLVMCEAEQRGRIEVPAAIRELVANLDSATEEIDRGLRLVVAPDGLTVGGGIDLAGLDGRRVGELLTAGLIDMGDDGRWTLTAMERAVWRLPDVYAEPMRGWRVLG